MLRDTATIAGKITATVFGPDGKVKRWNPKSRLIQLQANAKNLLRYRDIYYFRRVLFLIIMIPLNIIIDAIVSRLMISVSHNIITDQGDALIADIMSQTPAKQKLDNTNAYITAGTAYSATNKKAQTGVHTASGSRKGMQSNYPKQKGTFGNTDDNVVQYRCIFAAADLNATINEAALLNHITAGECLSYGAVSPDAVVASTDTLQIDWEHTYTGA